MGPITSGSLIQRSFEVFRAGFVPYTTLSLIFYSPLLLLLLMPDLWSSPTDLGLTMSISAGILLGFASAFLVSIAAAAVVYGVFQELRGRPVTIGQCVSVAWSRAPAVLLLAILMAVATGIGFVLCVIPGVVLTLGWFVASPALIVERLGPIDAMKRSWELTDTYKLTLFFLALAIGVTQFLVGALVNLAFGISPLSGQAPPVGIGWYQLIDTVVAVTFIAFNAVAAAVAYHDIRSFGEGLEEGELLAVFD